MLGKSLNTGRLQVVIILIAAGILFNPPSFAGEPQSKDAKDALIKAQIEAGEFAPALETALHTISIKDRDTWLAQIAMGQARAGARNAAFNTAGGIGNDQSRSQALSGVSDSPMGGQVGGGTQADFDSLINLITATVKPNSWDSVGGPGSISPFPTGVYVDPQGVLRPLLKETGAGSLENLRASSSPKSNQENVRRSSPLRKISLTRLEKYVQLCLAAGRPASEDMQVLAGLQRIKYVFVYPKTGDIVLAGPAGDWKIGNENLIVSADSGQPVVLLDDLVVVLRQMMSGPDASFGCLIMPKQESLSQLQDFLKESNKRPIHKEERKEWLQTLRSRVGKQDIEVYGLDPGTRAARVMVAADYHMKLVGMGLAQGVPGVKCYLDLVKIPHGEAPPPMSVLRWWFTLNYDAILAAKDHSAFAVCGQGVKVLSENERLSADGQQIHTNESEAWNRQFAHSFTENFEALSVKYPIYAELRNIFDLALVCSLIREENMAEKTGWHMTCFGNPKAYLTDLGPAPKTVESVVNYRIINGIIVAGVSGGVRVKPAGLVTQQAMQMETGGDLVNKHSEAALKNSDGDNWWWD
jgi:hypothetical protein